MSKREKGQPKASHRHGPRVGRSPPRSANREQDVARRPLGREEFLRLLKSKLQEKNQDKHPLMPMLYSGKLTPKQVRA